MFSERFDRALVFAHDLHRSHRRKTSGVPYVAHLLGVATLVIEDGGSEDEAIAALLHDSLEDRSNYYQGGRDHLAHDIREQFGEEVLRLVEALTERPAKGSHLIVDKRERWRAHKQEYINQIISAEPSVRRISCADSIHNVRSMTKDFGRMGEQIWSRFLTRNRDDQLWAYHSIAQAFTAAGVGALALELRRAVNELFKATGLPLPEDGNRMF